ncbi:SDR family oxidoreductase [Microbacterium sp. LRZ72]|uniref:SDR family NAD(P)-dependent oxidoreductase n=1 Tax=Microbacterium sp. LRZ72 TaxID=2942481 RepID=UPI0029B55D7A|nr:SDR family NAD(P)-dependent oxidoreductase [Microbacterium sp. LRZ72]MDX2376113.1 SDR family oxidoreductase [Microbacterium sp. LRZ72]
MPAELGVNFHSALPSGKRVALVTGSAQGLGLAVARAFLNCGYRVVLSDVNEESLIAAHLDLRQAHEVDVIAAAHADVTDDDSVSTLVGRVADWAGRLDVLVTNAGLIMRSPTEALDFAAWQSVIDVNLTGAVRCAKAAFPMLRDSSGSIINIGSVGSSLGMPQRAAYNSSKTAIIGLTRTLAAEWGPLGIRVNAIAPGFIDTSMMRSGFEKGLLNEDSIITRIPQRRLGASSEVAGAAVFLASPAASYINGACLPVDGGVTIDGTFF